VCVCSCSLVRVIVRESSPTVSRGIQLVACFVSSFRLRKSRLKSSVALYRNCLNKSEIVNNKIEHERCDKTCVCYDTSLTHARGLLKLESRVSSIKTRVSSLKTRVSSSRHGRIRFFAYSVKAGNSSFKLKT